MFKLFSTTCLFLLWGYSLPAIAQVNSISFNSTAIAPPIALTPNTALPSTIIGKVTVRSDNVNGFTVSATSTNGGALKRSSGELIAYTLTYNGNEQGQLTLTRIVEDVNSVIIGCSQENGCDREIKIAITQNAIAAKPSGRYADQLTFTLMSK